MKSCIILLLGVLIVKAGNVETNEISPQKQITTVEDVKLEIKIFFGVLRGLIDAAINYIFDAFIPTLHRVRRSALPQEQYYMDTIVTGVGAMFDKQNCRARVTCNAGKVVQHKVPGSRMAFGLGLLDPYMPDNWQGWYGTVKSSVLEHQDDCVEHYKCELLPDE